MSTPLHLLLPRSSWVQLVNSPVLCNCSGAAPSIPGRTKARSFCNEIALDRQRKRCSYSKQGTTRQCCIAEIARQHLAMKSPSHHGEGFRADDAMTGQRYHPTVDGKIKANWAFAACRAGQVVCLHVGSYTSLNTPAPIARGA